MEHRIGICSACGARYRIPSSFTPNQARCRTCSGVVQIDPVRAAGEVSAAGARSRRDGERGNARERTSSRDARERIRGKPPHDPSGARELGASRDRGGVRDPSSGLDPIAAPAPVAAQTPVAAQPSIDVRVPVVADVAGSPRSSVVESIALESVGAAHLAGSRSPSPRTQREPASRVSKRRRPVLLVALIALLVVSLFVWLVARGGGSAEAHGESSAATAPHTETTPDSGRAATSAGDIPGAGH
jgi:hypothetical protein